MISLERLYSRQCPKSINAEQTPRGAKPLTLDDILNIIGRVQHKHMVGSFVLEVRIALDMSIRKRLVAAVTEGFKQHDHISDGMAAAMAEIAIQETCDTSLCKKCNGTGVSFSRKQAKVNNCKSCEGTGQRRRTKCHLHKNIMDLLEPYDRMSKTDWYAHYYKIYLDATNELNYAASDAAGYAKKLLRQLEETWNEAA